MRLRPEVSRIGAGDGEHPYLIVDIEYCLALQMERPVVIDQADIRLSLRMQGDGNTVPVACFAVPACDRRVGKLDLQRSRVKCSGGVYPLAVRIGDAHAVEGELHSADGVSVRDGQLPALIALRDRHGRTAGFVHREDIDSLVDAILGCNGDAYGEVVRLHHSGLTRTAEGLVIVRHVAAPVRQQCTRLGRVIAAGHRYLLPVLGCDAEVYRLTEILKILTQVEILRRKRQRALIACLRRAAVVRSLE